MQVHVTGSRFPHTQVLKGRQRRVHWVRPTSSPQVFLESIPFRERVGMMHQHVISCESRLCFVDGSVVQDNASLTGSSDLPEHSRRPAVFKTDASRGTQHLLRQ